MDLICSFSSNNLYGLLQWKHLLLLCIRSTISKQYVHKGASTPIQSSLSHFCPITNFPVVTPSSWQTGTAEWRTEWVRSQSPHQTGKTINKLQSFAPLLLALSDKTRTTGFIGDNTSLSCKIKSFLFLSANLAPEDANVMSSCFRCQERIAGACVKPSRLGVPSQVWRLHSQPRGFRGNEWGR